MHILGWMHSLQLSMTFTMQLQRLVSLGNIANQDIQAFSVCYTMEEHSPC
jgi:hypothetical protein